MPPSSFSITLFAAASMSLALWYRTKIMKAKDTIGAQILAGKKHGVCVFLGSSSGKRPEYVKAATHLGKIMAERGVVLIYGGGNIGLMGTIARSVIEHGGDVIGVIPRSLARREVCGEVDEKIQVILTDTMHERKQIMATYASHGFIGLPGGFGSLEEICETITWSQLGIQRKNVGLFNMLNYYDPLYKMFTHAVQEGFIREKHLNIVKISNDADELLSQVMETVPPQGLLNTWPSNLGPI